MNFSELKQLAESALEQELDTDQSILRIETYTAAFHLWYDAHSALFDQDGDEVDDSLDAEQLSQLVELHGRVMERAEELRTAASQDMIALRQRGKGMKAYVDTLPKRISQRRTRKG